MELKGLADQLNSACEAHFGVSQFSGIPLRDELHQANSLEPEFEAIRWEKASLVESTPMRNINGRSSAFSEDISESRKIENREALIRSTLKKVFENEIRCELKDASGIRPIWDDGFCKLSTRFCKSPTLYFFEEPKFQDGCRIWKIRICNCSNNPSLKFKEKIEDCKSTGDWRSALEESVRNLRRVLEESERSLQRALGSLGALESLRIGSWNQQAKIH
eukprot:GHVP01020643.1.p1 GENE.GHVP01020643.1~~GHVP01020643.1.p1  ORF type:complete len:219 (+),score=38.18 GHVP01020643.1:22-678(+)